MTNDQTKDLDALVSDFCRRAQLYGCDTVQVLMTIHNEAKQETYTKKEGRGNWYARQGLAHEFLKEDEARTAECIKSEFGGEDG
jgi:hypothetical protein